MDKNLSGVLNVNKPKGMTSFYLVRKIRSKLGVKKAGHCGTLDPGATGVMLVCFGSSTKKSAFMMKMEKNYAGRFMLGISTDTDDISGRVISRCGSVNCDRDDVERAMRSFEGEIDQRVPLYSAVKLAGTPLYKYARKGISVEAPVKKVNVKYFRLTNFSSPAADFEISCSSGTYVRSLVRDTGEKLGCGAALLELSRTSVGGFTAEKSLEFDWVMNAGIDEILSKSIV